MSQSLFINGLAWATTNQSLTEFFESIGEVACAKVITDRETNRSKGYGFVQYVDEENNQKAIEILNGRSLDGRRIIVALSRPKGK